MMFHSGDLRSGIALALSEVKSVACFVADQSPESALWQSSHLADEQVARALDRNAITLRIEAASEEAGFLSAYCPLTAIPSLIIIHNGHLLLDLRSGTPQHEFKAAILKALSSTSSATTSASTSQGSLQSQDRDESLSESAASDALVETASDATPPTSSSGTQQAPVVERLLSERRQKLEKQKEEKDAALKAERKAKAKERAANLDVDPQALESKQLQYAQQRRQREKEAKSERDRVLRLIEHDKAERKEREEQRKSSAIAEGTNQTGAHTQGHGQPSIPNDAQKQSLDRDSPISSIECFLQVRLLDGSLIRAKFRGSDTIGSNVKSWIDHERADGHTPYTLKQILTPAPNRTLSITDEDLTLQDLGLLPTCTLVLVPIQGYTNVYDQNRGVVSRALSTCYRSIFAVAAFVMTAILAILNKINLTPSGRREQEHQRDFQPRNAEMPTQGTASGIKIHRLHDQQEKEEKQFYNGNQLNFEPRKDDEEGK